MWRGGGQGIERTIVSPPMGRSMGKPMGPMGIPSIVSYTFFSIGWHKPWPGTVELAATKIGRWHTQLAQLWLRGEIIERRSVLGYYLRKYSTMLFWQEPQARCAANECPKCFKDKLYEYGVVDSYRMKFTGSKSVDQCYSLNKCCVCFNLVNQTIQWMDLIVCTVSSQYFSKQWNLQSKSITF